MFQKSDLNGVLLCGSTTTEKKELLQPEYYIILNHFKHFYQVVSYKSKRIFSYKELPYDMKRIIIDKCIEENAGSFVLIPEFMNKQTDSSFENERKELDAITSKLYDDDIILRFYENSADNFPGKNNGEHVPSDQMTDFVELSRTPNWRHKLGTRWIQPFTLDGHKWASVEHYYQGSKYKKNNPDFYLDFSLDSKTALSKSSEMAKLVGGKTGQYNGVVMREKHVTIDPTFYSKDKDKILFDAEYAKYSQNEDLKRLLIATNKAKLVYIKKGKKPEICFELMKARNKLSLDNV
jgi:predicted NAD-dependent protein-ADP-ribosyltransferase YbiA (DUF1768 family)